MEDTLNLYLEGIALGAMQTYRNLAMVPLCASRSISLDYLLLDEALRTQAIEVQEVSAGGSVPELTVVNNSPHLVLILDGEELVGAKQNRIVNTTILIAAHSTTVIPVSCVEQGRWNYLSKVFYSEERMMAPELRARKAEDVLCSLRMDGGYLSNQGAIWNGIAEKATRRKAESRTMAMRDIYEKERPALEEYVQQFALADGQVGALFAINGKVVGMDSFGKPETCSQVFRKLLQSYALDAIDWLDPKKETAPAEGIGAAFLEEIRKAKVETHPSVALGEDLRFESDKVTGFSLVVNDEVLHLSVFAKRSCGHKEDGCTPMERFSRRRRRMGK